MVVVEGIYEKGVVKLLKPLSVEDGRKVNVTLLEDDSAHDLSQYVVDENDTLGKLIEACQMDTGITDLAQQHDHYLHGLPKRKE